MTDEELINLFNLIDVDEKRPGSWVMGSGRNLNSKLKTLIEQISLDFGSKRKFTNYLIKKFNLSQSVAERFVWLMKEWHPLFLIKEVSDLSNMPYLDIQWEIDYLKMNQPPLKIFKAVKILSKDLCKFIGAFAADGTSSGNFIRITDGYESNMIALAQWLYEVFGVQYSVKRVKDSNEWSIEFHSGIIARYLHHVFDFPSGTKQYTVSEPKIIKQSSLVFRKCYASGVLMFESGVGIKHEVELCVSSKDFKDSIANILFLSDIKFRNMENKSGKYWRLWSNRLNKNEAQKWLDFFEPNTQKWFLLKNYIDGYQGKTDSFEKALDIFDKAYPPKSASKVCLKDVILAVKKLNKTHRYELASYLCDEKSLSSYGGKWAHSLHYYLEILKKANAISISREKFGKKKSFGSIIREVYHYNPKIEEWKIPFSFN